MKTRLPESVPSCASDARVLTVIIKSWPADLFGVNQCNSCIEHAVRKSPLVVVPGRDLDQRPRYPSQAGINNTGRRGMIKIDRNEWLVIVGQNTFKRPLLRRL